MKKIKPIPNYFDEKEEEAFLKFIHSNSIEERNKIYNELLIEPFRIMKETILKKYPIYIGNHEIDEVEQDALTHLIEHMNKYKRFIIEYYDGSDKWIKLGEGYKFNNIDDAQEKLNNLIEKNNNVEYKIFTSKAYSYCQTIIRNYYKDHSKKNYKEKKINLPYDDYSEELNNNTALSYEIDNKPIKYYDLLINNMINKIECIITGDTTTKKNEMLVGEAIVNILKNWQVLFQEDSPDGKYNKKISNKFAKNKILLLLKEQTGLSTKDIRNSIKLYKSLYFMEKFNYFND
jgi:hypothetical protein